ncbi:MAG: MarR family winged helix-turn-helix transcriptional regulator [Bacillota bacterium]
MPSDLAYRLSEGMSAFCRANMNRKSNLPIRSSEMRALIFITLNAGDIGVRAVELSDYFGIQKSSVSSIIASLEKQGYVKRTLSENDKRNSPLFPTKRGTKLVNETIEEYHRISNRLIDIIGIKKSEEFLQILNMAAKIIQNGDVNL